MIFATPRLIVRRFSPRDLESFVAMRADPEVARFQNWENYTFADGVERFKQFATAEPGGPGWFQMALEERATGQFAGDCGLRIMEQDRRLAQIGYTIVRSRWNLGLATEAVTALTDFAFREFPIHRITASVDPRNAGSCRVLEKSGYVKEAHFRQSEWFKGAWADDAIYARLRHH